MNTVEINAEYLDKKKKLVQELRMLGVQLGDTLFITADLMVANLHSKSRIETEKLWLESLIEVVGEDGTILAAAYTKSFSRFSKNHSLVFTSKSRCTSGALPSAMLKHRDCHRSTHPTNSIVAIGRHSRRLCEAHTEFNKSYDAIKILLDLNGKHLMIGTLDEKNAPLGFHYAQQEIGETLTCPGVGLRQTFFINEKTNEKKIFTRWDIGGCSGAGYKTIGHHILKDAISFGKIGNALSALIDAKKSVQICKELLVKNRKSMICDDNTCLFCQGRWSVNGMRTIIFYAKLILIRRRWFFGKLFG